MNTKRLLLLATTLAVAGCAYLPAWMPGASSRIACRGACNVEVTVTATSTGCTVSSISADIVRVGPQAQPTIIKWQMSQGTDRQFNFRQANAIAFDKGAAPPSGVMQNGAGAGRAVTVNDNHTGKSTEGSWDYTIYVTGNGNVNCKYDPTIINDDGSGSNY